jgi:hypothetical protein
LTETVDISWAKSDVFIWSNVEPSIGTISACLPTLRRPLMHFLHFAFGYQPSSGGAGASYVLPDIITISRKRTRPIREEALEDTQITRVGEEDEPATDQEWPSRFGMGDDETLVLRPDEDKVYLTNVVGRKDSQTNVQVDEEASSREGIIVEKEVTWGESGV